MSTEIVSRWPVLLALTVASSDRDGSDRLTDAAVERLFAEARAAYFDRCATVDESSLSIEASFIGSQRAPVSDVGVTVSVSVVEVFPEGFTMSARLRPREGDGIAATASCRLSPGGPVLPATRDEFIALAHRATHVH
jgi:hypothetical protein